jgi:subtilisin-like proprotein convertase family protein
LRIEPLEDRRLLSITVNSLTDELDGSILDGDISLRDALLAATPFETINFDASLTAGGPAMLNLTLGELRITKDVTINGPGSGLFTIDASGNDLSPINIGDGSRVFNINNGGGTSIDVKINSLTLTGGDALLDGGGIRNFENLTTTNLVVAGNASQRDGGGIFNSGSLTLIDSVISGNASVQSGGGVFSLGPYLIVHESTINDNSAADGGGVASGAAGNYLTIRESTIDSNTASNNGGGVLASNGQARILNSAITDNRATQDGGGIHSLSSTLSVVDSEVENNRSYSDGGGIFSDGGSTTVQDMTISGNISAADGGGIFNSAGALHVSASTISSNESSSGSGGGISNHNGTATIERTNITSNRAGGGGGVASQGGTLAILESTVASNIALGSGGGVWSNGAGLNVLSSTISGNSAVDDGGGLRIESVAGQSAVISHSTVALNRARAYYFGLGTGSGIMTSGSSGVELRHTITANNTRFDGTQDDIIGTASAYFSLIGVGGSAVINNLGGSLIGTQFQPIEPLLEALADNGGPTRTHALRPNSPAIDAGDPSAAAGSSVPQFDQRGTSFARIRNGDGQLGARIDIGAFEVQPGAIRGQKWNDLDSDGIKDSGEPGLQGWTIFIDKNGNGELDVVSQTISSSDVPKVAAPSSSASSTILVEGFDLIDDVNVTLNISQTIDSSAQVFLIGPSGTAIQLFAGVGASGSNFTNTTLDDEAAIAISAGSAPFSGTFRPLTPLSLFDGQNPNGAWTLQFTNLSATSGTLNSWSLTLANFERSTTTDAAGNYEFTEVAPGIHRVGEVAQPGWTKTSQSAATLDATLAQLEITNGLISALVPTRFDFTEGESGNSINDGGNDMYDGGNFLNTDVGFQIPYTNGAIVAGDFAFGPDSQYFTAKYQGLFVLAATDISVSQFSITGNAGADGGGSVNGEVLQTTVNGKPYTIYLKRTFDAFDPSINQIIMVPGDGVGVTHQFPGNTDDDFHSVQGLSSTTEIYYALVARQNGLFLENADVLNIANAFLSNIGTAGLHSVRVDSGVTVEGINFGNHALPGSIHGQKWNDLDDDGVRDAGEPGLVDWTIYFDQNNNGQLDLNSDNLEPDDYVSGTVLNNVKAGVSLSIAEYPEFNVLSGAPSASASTGTQVIRSDLGPLWFDGLSLRVNLSLPTNFVSIDAVGDNPNDRGTLSAYAADDTLLATYDTAALDAGDVEAMAISRPTAEIAYVIARGAGSEAITLDNLRYGTDEPTALTDANGDYEFLNVAPGPYTVAEVLPAGWLQTSPISIGQMLGGLNANSASIAALVPTRYDFSEGETGTSIIDGGNNMYDGGNFLSTNLGSEIPYTNGTIQPSAAFGPGSQYFTAKYPGLFVMAATNISITNFRIDGNVGADGLGNVNGVVFHTTVNGKAYTILLKRTYNALVPSINHIIIVPGNGVGVTHNSVANTDTDLHNVTGLASVKQLYYALVAREGGAFLADASVISIANAIVSNIAAGPQFAVVGPGQEVTGIDFGNHATVPAPLLAGDYNLNGTVDAADYTLWRNALHSHVSVYSGADGDGNGWVTWNDYMVWKHNFGQVQQGAGAGIEASAASQPAGVSESGLQSDAMDTPFFVLESPSASAQLTFVAPVPAQVIFAAPAEISVVYEQTETTTTAVQSPAGGDHSTVPPFNSPTFIAATRLATPDRPAIASLSSFKVAQVARKEDALLLAWDAWDAPRPTMSDVGAAEKTGRSVAGFLDDMADDDQADAHDCVFGLLPEEQLVAVDVGS